jgi:hypothetical protein
MTRMKMRTKNIELLAGTEQIGCKVPQSLMDEV